MSSAIDDTYDFDNNDYTNDDYGLDHTYEASYEEGDEYRDGSTGYLRTWFPDQKNVPCFFDKYKTEPDIEFWTSESKYYAIQENGEFIYPTFNKYYSNDIYHLIDSGSNGNDVEWYDGLPEAGNQFLNVILLGFYDKSRGIDYYKITNSKTINAKLDTALKRKDNNFAKNLRMFYRMGQNISSVECLEKIIKEYDTK